MTTPVPLFEAAKPWMERLAVSSEAIKLCRGIAWSEGFSFHVAGCTSPEVATALQLWLLEAVPRAREHPVSHARISPYPLDWREADPAPVDGSVFVQQVFDALLSSTRTDADLIVIDGAWARPGEAEAWGRVFAMLNVARNRISRDVPSALLLVLPPPLVREFAKTAVDLWSIRSSGVEFGDPWGAAEAQRRGEYEADEELLRRARAGDSQATRVFMNRHAPSVRRHLELMGAHDIEDIIQGVFEELLQRDRPIGLMRGWLIGRARELSQTSQTTRRIESRASPLLRYKPVAVEQGLADERRIDLEDAISKLPSELREVISLRLAGLSLTEIAKICALSRQTVHRRLERATNMLSEGLGEIE